MSTYTNAIETAAWYNTQVGDYIEERDAAIYAAHASGGRSLREIATRVGLSHTQVKNIVDRMISDGRIPAADLHEDIEPNEAKRLAKLSQQIDAILRPEESVTAHGGAR